MHSINTLTPDNSVLCLIDHQPWVAFPVRSISPEHLSNNVLGLARAARALNVPVVLTTINGEGGPLRDPLFAGLGRLWPDVTPIDRSNTNAWSDAAFVAAIEATGRGKLVMAGLWTEVCLAQTAISAMAAGYEVFFVADASGGLSPEGHERACQRMIQAGAVPLTWFATVAEWCPDNTAPEYQGLYPITLEHGGGVGWAVEYVVANLPKQEATS
jgi:nicotinamidase-related amidase